MRISREEFVRLALEQFEAVSRVARGLARDAAEADDLVQETYLHALTASEGFELRAFGIRPWLLRILHNLHVNRAKREGRGPRAAEAEQLEAAEAAEAVEAARIKPAPSVRPLADDRLDRAIGALPPDLRMTLTLWAVDELSYKEIAFAVGVPVGTVMSRLHRARRQLRRRLAGHPAGRRYRPAARGSRPRNEEPNNGSNNGDTNDKKIRAVRINAYPPIVIGADEYVVRPAGAGTGRPRPECRGPRTSCTPTAHEPKEVHPCDSSTPPAARNPPGNLSGNPPGWPSSSPWNPGDCYPRQASAAPTTGSTMTSTTTAAPMLSTTITAATGRTTGQTTTGATAGAATTRPATTNAA